MLPDSYLQLRIGGEGVEFARILQKSSFFSCEIFSVHGYCKIILRFCDDDDDKVKKKKKVQ